MWQARCAPLRPQRPAIEKSDPSKKNKKKTVKHFSLCAVKRFSLLSLLFFCFFCFFRFAVQVIRASDYLQPSSFASNDQRRNFTSDERRAIDDVSFLTTTFTSVSSSFQAPIQRSTTIRASDSCKRRQHLRAVFASAATAFRKTINDRSLLLTIDDKIDDTTLFPSYDGDQPFKRRLTAFGGVLFFYNKFPSDKRRGLCFSA
jgi:hypothetical protein